MSEIYNLIDDYMIWNKSSSDLILDRPGSSGTMFVDFTSNGEMEVSYRNGIHKKLPIPPGPSKIPTRPTTGSYCRESKSQQHSDIQLQQMGVKQVKVHPPRPPYGLRYDSVISSGTRKIEQHDTSQRSSHQIARTLQPALGFANSSRTPLFAYTIANLRLVIPYRANVKPQPSR
ncbi:hypothetical protein E8E13_003132 [Curvularia kusanoi]|uniref:Uncharacterized protein n=1 Tax=Curvularia kusanoi TaxID=90978 RepID=A0A9P4W5H6_CURKU|nr:hypothetical protein E8E13_003132 [Curvularia kusanoi]